MDLETIRDFALSFKESSEGFPFDSDTLVFKVAGKMFLLVSLEYNPIKMSLKHLPEKGLEYREHNSSVEGAYHMNKTHWSSVVLDGSVDWETLRSWIQDSHDLVVSSLPKYKQKELRGDA